MRPHLPLSLRSALVACVASAHLFATISTGAIAAVGVVFALASAPAAMAAKGDLETTFTNPYADIEYTLFVRNAASSGSYQTEATLSNNSHNLLADSNSLIQYTSNGNCGSPFDVTGVNLAMETTDANGAARNGGQMTVNADVKASSVWFKSGRYLVNNSSRLANAGDLYVKGGQLYVSTASTLANSITFGASNYEENNSYGGASLRIDANCTLSGAVRVEESVSFAFNGARTLTLANLTMKSGSVISLVQGNGSAACTVSLTGTIRLVGDGTALTSIVGETADLRFSSSLKLDMNDYTGELIDGQAIENLVFGSASTTAYQGFEVLGYAGGEAYVTLQDGAVIFHRGIFEPPMADAVWDAAWGLSSDEQPAKAISLALTADDLSGGYYSMSGIDSLFQTVNGHNAVVAVFDGEGGSFSICGGYAADGQGNGTTTRDFWIDVKSGSYVLIVGGNYCNNWNSGSSKNIVGDTHVQLEGTAAANHVIGSNYKDGKGVTHTGNSYVSIGGQAIVKGNIIGGGTTTHSSTNTITGNTLVTVHSVQYSNDANNLDSMTKGYIVGGSAWTNNASARTVIGGNTAVVIDLSDVELSGTAAQNNFVKTIVGGSYANSTSEALKASIGGNTSVRIVGKEGVTFTGRIFGGTYTQKASVTEGQVTIQGDCLVSIEGASTFTNNIIGAGNKGEVRGNVRVELDSAGTYGTADHAIIIRGTTGMTVSGSKTLALKGDFTDANFEHVTLSDFDSIDVAADNSATFGNIFSADNNFTSVKKTGEGSLTLQDTSAITALGAHGGVLTITDERNLSLDYLGFSQGATLNMTGDITLNAGATLAVAGSEAYAVAQRLAFSGTGDLTIDLTGFELRPGEAGTAVTILEASSLTGFENATLLLNGLDAHFYKLQYNAEKNSFELATRTDMKMWKGGTWNTLEDNKSWINDGMEEAFSNSEIVYFTDDAIDKTVTIEGDVAPGGVFVNGTDYVFTGTGSVTGEGALSLARGASLTIENANSFSGGTVLGEGSVLTIENTGAIGTMGDNANTLGTTAGEGTLNINFSAADTAVYLKSDSFKDFTGTLQITQGTVSLGNTPAEESGADAALGASKVLVGEHGTFLTQLGGGSATLTTGKSFASEVYVQSGGTIGDRAGHVNWTGNLYLNTTDLTGSNPSYDQEGVTHLLMHWGKNMVLDGLVQGAGTVDFTTGRAEGNPNDSVAHKVILTNAGNTFSGTWQLSGEHFQALGLAQSRAAALASVNLTGAKAHLILMSTSAEIKGLDSAEGKGAVYAEGTGNFELTVSQGTFHGVISDTAAGASAATTLGLVKKGAETLTLTGANTYSGKTTVQGGALVLTHASAFTMHSIAMGAGARMSSASTSITLASGSTLEFDMTGAVADGGSGANAFITWNKAALTLADASHSVTLTGLENLEAGGVFTLASWDSLASAQKTFKLTNSAASDDDNFSYELMLNDEATALILKVTDNRVNSGFVWAGDSGSTWRGDSGANWEKAGEPEGDIPNGEDVFFKSDHAGTVVLAGEVSPRSVKILGGNYIFESDLDETGSIADMSVEQQTTLTVSGNAAVTLNLANTYTGGTNIIGGSLTAGVRGALGGGNVSIGGGELILADSTVLTQANALDFTGGTLTLNGDEGTNAYGMLNFASWTGGKLSLSANVSASLTTAMAKAGQTVALAAGSTLTLGEGALGADTYSVSATGTGALKLQFTSNVYGGHILNTGAFNGTVWVTGGNFMIHQIATGNNAVVKLGEGNNATNMEVQSNESPILTRNYVIEGSAVSIHLTGTADRTFTGSFTGRAFAKEGAYGMTLQGAVDLTDGTLTVNNGTLTIASAQVGNLGSGWNIAQGKTLAFTNATNNNATGVTYGNAISGAGTVQLNSGQLELTNGAVGGSVNLAVAEGELTLTGAHTSTGALAVTNEKATVRLGTADTAATWAGSTLSGAGTFKIVNGSLAQAMTRADGSTATIAVDAGADISVNLGGTSGSLLSSVILGAGSTLTNVGGNLLVGEGGLTGLNLTLNSSNVGIDGRAATAKIGQGTGNSLTISSPTTVNLDIDLIVDLLTEDREASHYLTLTSGSLICANPTDIHFSKLVSDYGLRVTGVDERNGSLIVTGKVTGIYKVTGEAGSDPDEITSYSALETYAGVAIRKNQTLTAHLAGAPAAETKGLLVNNLMGAGGSSFVVDNTGAADAGNAVVILNNKEIATGGDTPDPAGADTEMAGNILGNGGVTFIKSGLGTLTVNGTLSTDTLRVEEGAIVLNGYDAVIQVGSDISHIVLAGAEPLNRAATVAASLTIGADSRAGDLSDEGAGGLLTIGQGASLNLSGNSALAHSTIGGAGTLVLEQTLSLTNDAKLDGVALDLADDGTTTRGRLDLGSTNAHAVSTLIGAGAISGSTGSALTISGAKEGTFEGVLEGTGRLTVSGNALQTFRNVTTATKNWTLENSGRLHIVTATADGNAKLDFAGLTLTKGSTTQFTMNTDMLGKNEALITVTGDLTIQEGASITLTSTGMKELTADEASGLVATFITATGNVVLGEGESIDITLDAASTAFKKLDTKARLVNKNGQIVIATSAAGGNRYATAATTHNSLAGAELLWNLSGVDAQSMLGQVDAYVNLQQALIPSEAARAMAAAAGSTVASLGMAQKDALRDQMGWIRNRLTNMGVDASVQNDDMPYLHMWVQATGNHATLDRKGDESGYTLDTWGGTVGFDLDVSEHLTFGAAFTAAYGDLKATGAETATGDLDSYYVNLFGRAQVKRWTHKLILSVGINDAKLTRTVDYGASGYKARGTTNGTGFGAMYEVAYDAWMNEEETAVLQPLLNLSIVSTTMDAYSENDGGTAGNAGLNVGKQDMTVGTVALGVRLAGQLSENALGRASFGEFRVNVAQDMGDDRSSASVGFIGAPGMTQRIRGAKEGMTAIQIGAGLTVPVGEQSGIFFDVNADFRSHASSVNGSVGYRYDF